MEQIILLSDFDDEEIINILINNDYNFITLKPLDELELIKKFDIKLFPTLIIGTKVYQGKDNILEYLSR